MTRPRFLLAVFALSFVVTTGLVVAQTPAPQRAPVKALVDADNKRMAPEQGLVSTTVFGDPNKHYPDTYWPRPYDKRFVLNLLSGLIYQAKLKLLLPTHRDKPRLLKASNNKSQCVKLNSPSVLWSVLPKQINRQTKPKRP